MAVIGTFGSFTAARLGIYASQASLNVTGNNIANINTPGYTRQRMDLVSLYSYGTVRYANSYHQNIGYGVLTSSMSQLRDPFLDIRYREENAKSGAYEAKLDCLQELAHILDEVGKGSDDFGIIERQFNDLLSQLQNLNGKVGAVDYDTTTRGSAQTLVRLFNDYSKAMDTLGENKLNKLKEDVKTVNTLLTQIRDLSVQIRDAGIVGDPALELRDERNLCIDKLSAYMNIDVWYDEEKIDEFNSVERINISIADSGTPPIKLIQGIYGAQISMPETTAKRNPNYNPANQYISLDSDLVNGSIQFTDKARGALTAGGKALENTAAGRAALEEAVRAAVREALEAEEAAKDEDDRMSAADLNALIESRVTNTMNSIQTTPVYDEEANGRYLKADGTATNDAAAAEQVNNAKEGVDDNRLWMSVEPLKDAKGKYLRDENHKEIRESVDLTDNQLYGSLQALREFLTEKGEFSSAEDLQFDEFALQKRGLQYYKNALDALARKFADAFNKANRLNIEDVSEAYVVDPDTGNYLDRDGYPITFTDSDGNPVDGPTFFSDWTKAVAELERLNKKAATKEGLTDAESALKTQIEEYIADNTETAYDYMELLRERGCQLTDKWSFYNGGVLFSSNGDTNDATGITAGNITISAGWTSGDVRLLNTKKADGLDHSTADDNIMHMIELMSEDMDYFPGEVLDGTLGGNTRRYFSGSFQERLSDMNNILGVETQTTALQYNTYTATTLSLENSRQSVAGVDLNDEATSMMMFQKSYAAACQLMTTLDSMLDKLINGTLR